MRPLYWTTAAALVEQHMCACCMCRDVQRRTRRRMEVPAAPRTPTAHTSRGAHVAKLCPSPAHCIMHAEGVAHAGCAWGGRPVRAWAGPQPCRRSALTPATAHHRGPPPNERLPLKGVTVGAVGPVSQRPSVRWACRCPVMSLMTGGGLADSPSRQPAAWASPLYPTDRW